MDKELDFSSIRDLGIYRDQKEYQCPDQKCKGGTDDLVQTKEMEGGIIHFLCKVCHKAFKANYQGGRHRDFNLIFPIES